MWLTPAAMTCSITLSASACEISQNAAAPKIATVLMCPVRPKRLVCILTFLSFIQSLQPAASIGFKDSAKDKPKNEAANMSHVRDAASLQTGKRAKPIEDLN